MKFAQKLIGNEDERAVSPVIGVILMVAITVILAAVIAAFVLDLGQSQGANPAAGYSIDENSDGYVDIEITSIDQLDSIRIGDDCSEESGWGDDANLTNNDPSVGDSIEVDCDIEDVSIIGSYDGNEAVLN